jgi:hypothetical protein
MKWLSERISVKKHANFTTIVISPSKNFWTTVLLGTWLSMWFMIGVLVISSFYMFELKNQEKLILWVFLSFWIFYLFRIGRTFLWIHYGQELLKLGEFSIDYKRSIFKYGKANVIFYENIVGFSTHLPKENSFESVWESSPWISGGERIFMETKLKTFKFGRKLTTQETHSLLDTIKMVVKKRRSVLEKNDTI